MRWQLLIARSTSGCTYQSASTQAGRRITSENQRMPMPTFRLQFPVAMVEVLAARYDFDADDAVAAAGAGARHRGYYTKPELSLLCEWKSVRSKSRVAQNSDVFVQAITRAAFATEDEFERMTALCALRGVEAPTASVLLHFAFPDRYPIIDWRALESLGQPEQATYPVRYWLAYVDACRALAKDAGVSMRVLDKALWQHSRERRR
jgi:hypothetical protein